MRIGRVDHDAILRVKSLGRFALSTIKVVLTCYLIAASAVLPVQAQTNTFAATNLSQSWSGDQTFNGIVDSSNGTSTRPVKVVTLSTIPLICSANKDMILVSDASPNLRQRLCNASGNGFDVLGGTGIPNAFVVDGVTYANLAAAYTAAGTTGVVIIPSSYAGTDVNANSNHIQTIDLRGKPDRYRGFINMLTDCGLKGTGLSSDDDAPNAQACFTAFPGHWFVFPPTRDGGACSYWFGSTVFPKGEGAHISGASSGFKNSNTTQGGTVICSAAGVTPFWLDMTPNSSSGITIDNLSLKGSEGTDHLVTPTKLNIPSGANLPQFTRSITTIQRTAGFLTVVTPLIRNEGLTQQVKSTVKISGVVGDTTMNGNCDIATLTGQNTFGENPTGFTCPQNGPDSGPFGAVGTVSLPTEGVSTADAIRVCSNFNRIRNVTIDGFGRHGINADMQAGHGCTTLFSDDLIVEDSTIMGNQGDGFYCQGVDCNAGTMMINPIYYNLLWGVEDQSSLGNNWFGNQVSNNGSQWASLTTPATKTISTIARTLTSGRSQVSVVLSVVDTNIKLGSCVVVAGVTDATFNTTAGQCFFVNSFTDSTHFGYEQPGAPADAASSGGTSRMAKFSEAYLSAGVDSGAVKVGTQSQTYSQPWVGNYIEGGQDCKFSPGSLFTFGGANMPTCASTSTWQPGGAFFQNSFNNVIGSTVTSFLNNKDQNLQIFFLPGKNGGTTRHTTFRWFSNNPSADSWGLDVDPSGAAGTTGSWILNRGTAGGPNHRLSFFGATNASGITRISSESTGAVQINIDANSGTGGFTVCSGGASPTCPASSSIGSDFGFFGPYFKSSTTNPASAGAVRLAKTDAINFRNNANGADVAGVALDASDRVVLGGAAGVVATSIPVPGPIGGTTPAAGTFTTTTSNTSATSPAFISSTVNPAAAGAVRLAKTDIINARNNANGADIPLIQLNASDQAVCGNANGCVDINGNKFGTIIASGTSALGTVAITATTCATVVTTSATNTATTDSIEWSFNAAPGTGYTSGLHVLPYPTANNVNFLVCNPTAGPLTPAAATLNWRVIR